jgi:hypothetical protein
MLNMSAASHYSDSSAAARRIISGTIGRMRLPVACLLFLYINFTFPDASAHVLGTIFDETSDDLTITFIPSSWEQFFVESAPLNIIFQIFHLYPVPYSTKVSCLFVVCLILTFSAFL